MCSVCDEVKGKSQKEALNLISAAVTELGYNNHLSKLMDKVLGTQAEDPGTASKKEVDAFRAMKKAVEDPE